MLVKRLRQMLNKAPASIREEKNFEYEHKPTEQDSKLRDSIAFNPERFSDVASSVGASPLRKSVAKPRTSKSPFASASGGPLSSIVNSVELTRVERVVGYLQYLQKSERVYDVLLKFIYEMKNVLGVYSVVAVILDKEYQQMFTEPLWHGRERAHLKKFHVGGEVCDGVVESLEDNIDFVFNDISIYEDRAQELPSSGNYRLLGDQMGIPLYDSRGSLMIVRVPV